MHDNRSFSEATRATLLLRLSSTGAEREIAWTQFNDLYAPIISGFARRMGADRGDIDDLVQEVLKAFFCATPEFTYDPAKGRFRGYLKSCVWNKLTEIRRKRGREQQALGSDKSVNPDDLAAVDTVWNDVWETEKLGRALVLTRQRYAGNPERRRTFRAFELCTLLDRPMGEVSAELEMSIESVRAAKSRVSRALRESFDQMDDIIG